MKRQRDDSFAVANAHWVTDFLAVGGDLAYDEETAVNQAADLVLSGITHILDVRQEADDELVWEPIRQVDYRWAGIDDAGQRLPTTWFDDIVGWSLEALRQPGAKLLTHCHMGINRGPSAGFAVLLGLGWDPVDALTAIRGARPIAVIGYAEDALFWHHVRTGASLDEMAHDRERVAQWRRDNYIDVAKIIRKIRRREVV